MLRSYILGSLVVLLSSTIGCSASGYPRFVKISPNSLHIVFEDARHPRVYIYDLDSDQKHAFEGTVACLDREVKNLVLLPGQCYGCARRPDPLPCTLITIKKHSPEKEQLPSLPTGTSTPLILMEFVSGQERLLASVYDHRYVDLETEPGRYYTLTLGDSHWTEAFYQGKPPMKATFWRVYVPGGAREGGFIYCPVHERGAVPEGEIWGVDVKEKFQNGRLEHNLNSPDGRFVVKIRDLDDPWRRLTLTELGCGKKKILLDKNDVPLEVIESVMQLTGGVLLMLMGAKF